VNATKVVHRNSLVFWRAWRGSILLSVLSPVLFLTAMGLGLGSLVESDAAAFGGVDYLAFFSTGMLAANAMQSGMFAATYPLLNKIIWQKNYDAMLATPLTVADVYLGELSWIGLSLAQQTVPFFAVMSLFGIFDSPAAVLAIPVAILTGLGSAAVTSALTATLERDEAYTWVFRFVVTPLFLLSGTFFPVASLPGWAQVIAQFTPLYHGIELVRQVTIFDFSPVSAAGHLLYLLAFLALGSLIALRNLTKRLIT
jgi:lipooligosaccharide transport system permease protein